MAVESDAEKQYLKHLLTKEGAAQLKEMSGKEYITYADVLEMYPSLLGKMD